MKFLDWMKGVFQNMFSSKTLGNVLNIQPAVSSKMKTAIELWEAMYMNDSPWLHDPQNPVTSLGLAAMIASEKARLATIEMEVKVTGESERSEFIKQCLDKLLPSLRTNLEYGIALGGLVIKPYVVKTVDDKYTLDYSFVKATDFYPLAFTASGDVIESVFVDRMIVQKTVYTKIEHNKLVDTTLTVTTKAYKHTNNNGQTYTVNDEIGTEIPLTEVPEWANIEPVVVIENIDTLLFAYFKMPEANTIDLNSPLGVSGFAKAVDLIRNADEMYSNLLWEFEGGQLAIDVDRTALNPTKDSKGNPIEVLPKLQNRLYRHDLDLGVDEAYNVFSPSLRDANIINGLNNIRMCIEDVCSLARGTISEVTYAEARTATELKILKQRSFAANQDIQKSLEKTLKQIVSIADKYCDLYEMAPAGEYEVAYRWDDSIIVDKDAERQIDLLDLDKGLISRVEYRMKWMGETEEQAKQAIEEIDTMALDKMQKTNEVMAQTAQNNNGDDKPKQNGQEKTDAQASADKQKRANDSGVTTKNDKDDKNTK